MSRQLSSLLIGALLSSMAYADNSGSTWQGNAALALSRSAGNTNSTTYSAAVDEARTTSENKISLYFSTLYGKSQGVTSADKTRLGSRYDHNLGSQVFGFGLLEFEQDSLANLNLRTGVGAGFGYYFIKNDVDSFDVFSGLSYSKSNLSVGNAISGMEILLGEESSHKLSETTRLKQKLSVFPSVKNSGQYRSLFESGLVVDISSNMGLSISLQNKFNSDVGAGIKKSDTVLLTGLNIKL